MADFTDRIFNHLSVQFNKDVNKHICLAYIAHSDIRKAYSDTELLPETVLGWKVRNSQNEIVVCHGLAFTETKVWSDVTFVGRVVEFIGQATVQELKMFVERNGVKYERNS